MEANKVDSRLFDEVKNGDGRIPEEVRLSFKKLLDMSLEGSEFVTELYDKYELLTKFYLDKHRIACRKFCSHCCMQLVPATSSEMELIVEFIQGMNRSLHRSVIVHVKSRSRKYLTRLHRLRSANMDNATLTAQLKQEYMGITCPFLGKAGYCVVYPARPMICRTWKATRPCGITRSKEGDEGLLVKLIMDRLAMELINENDIAVHGKPVIMPLVAWPTTKNFYRDFF